MESREEIVARVSAEYAHHLSAWEVVHPRPIRSADDWYRPTRRISIEREPAAVVYRSIYPYVGVRPLQRRQR